MLIFKRCFLKIIISSKSAKPTLTFTSCNVNFAIANFSNGSIRGAIKNRNKYAIYAYTHGPVTGSGPSVKPLKYDVAPYWLS